MLTPENLNQFRKLVESFNREELVWINGYLSALLQENEKDIISAKPSVNKITITYGTETGNAKKLATEFASRAKKKGIHPKLVSLDQYRLNDLSKEEYFFTVISTQGDGEPPEGSKKFFDHIHKNGFKVNGLKYGVLALGDTSYPLFCKAGEDVDVQLNKLGGERIVALQKCDTDYEQEAGYWFDQILQNLGGLERNHAAPSAIKKKRGKSIYKGAVITNINLNDRGSEKQTHHIEVSSEDVDYLPGDSLGIVPQNPDFIVESVLSFIEAGADKPVLYKDEETTLGFLLKNKLNIVCLSGRVIQKYSSITGQEIPDIKMGLHDLLTIYPFPGLDFTNSVLPILEPVAPRLYSIASSPVAHNGEIHLTVARDRFYINDEVKFGLCSDFFSQVEPGTVIDFYIHKNDLFRLPPDEKDAIMIGPGTGVAPFRSFLSHRDATGSTGRNWLFFGDQHFTTDFLYQSEWQDWLQTGALSKMDVAFSRDEKQKIYVQHKMKKNGSELFEWIEQGAHVYICGAKEPMGVDVEHALLEIIEEYGQKSGKEAMDYLDHLKDEGRYSKDVY